MIVCLACKFPIVSIMHFDVMDFSPPDDHSVIVCTNCGHLMGFTEENTPRELTNDEMQSVMMDEEFQKNIKAFGKHRMM